jgi:ATP-dependent DNA helicase RecG
MDRDLSELPIQHIKGIGPQRARLLGRLNIGNVREALYYLPYRYEDREGIRKISQVQQGRLETVIGRVIRADTITFSKSRSKLFELTISDGTGILKGKWFNQPYMKRQFRAGQEVILSGIVKRDIYRGTGFEIDNPEYEFAEDDSESLIHTSRIVPVYRTTSGISVRVLRSILFNVVNAYAGCIEDHLPKETRTRYGLPGLSESISNVHFPRSGTDIDAINGGASPYHRRLSFDELLNLQIGICAIKRGKEKIRCIPFHPDGRLVSMLLTRLTFNLTAAQKRVFTDILHDMQEPHPMNRLIQGDVGSGKTIVALMAMFTAVECGYQAAMMAPTEILAEQHYINIHALAEDLGLHICLLTSGRKERPLQEIESGGMDIVIGTHALIQQGVRFRRLGLVVIDEQHRFGVMQRAALRKKALHPHVLVMTATPIPRTLAMTLYGDLDYSVIDELPPNRSPVITRLVSSTRKQEVYQAISGEVEKGGQVYVVYPVIEESEDSDLKSAMLGKEALERMFTSFRVGLIHGKMKSAERESAMTAFKKRGIDILVATTVIEVGVDVPNATMMVIVHAERFGLSQLHQLSGRVGRGGAQSYCYLLSYEPYSLDAGRRLDIMAKSSDGFRIAEEDLEIRGPGDFFGTRQSGIPDLKIADIARDAKLLEIARREASRIIQSDPELEGSALLKRDVERFWEGKIAIFGTS